MALHPMALTRAALAVPRCRECACGEYHILRTACLQSHHKRTRLYPPARQKFSVIYKPGPHFALEDMI